MTVERPTRPLVLVTGASAGIGASFARAYARQGCDLVLAARREDRLQALADELRTALGATCHVLRADFSQQGSAAGLMAEIKARGISIDILVNSAGYGVPGSYRGRPWQVHADFQQVMIETVAELCYLVIPDMRMRRRGTIINIASLAGIMPGTAGHTLYAPAKAWMIKFSECLSGELLPDGIRVCALCPGFTYTEFHDVNGMRPNVSRLPKLLWMTADAVVAEGLAAVARGQSVHVAGRINRLLALAARLLPGGLLRALVASRARDFRNVD